MTSPVFISYRRSDSQHATGRLYARLAPRYLAPAEIFLDVEGIAAGADFIAALRNQLNDCQVCLVIIGPNWLSATNENGQRRLDDPNDFVRNEVAEALARKITVIPLLVDNARMPSAAELPGPLKSLAARNALSIAHHRFDKDADAVAEKVLKALDRSPDAELDLIKALFSFKGTISRLPFWLGIILVFAVQLAVIAGVLWGFGVPVLEGLQGTLELPKQQKLMLQLASLWVWWPMLALVWKRIKDLGHGWVFFGVFVATALVYIAADFAGLAQEAKMLSNINLLLLIVLGCMKGTRFVAHEA